MTYLDLLKVAFVVILGSSTAFGLVGWFLLKQAKHIVRKNLLELTFWESTQAAKLAKIEKEIIEHAKKIDGYFQEKESDFSSFRRGGGTH